MPIDYKLYPKNWKTEIRPAIMKRAGEVRDDLGAIISEAKCEWCNVPNKSFTPRGSKVCLTVAHLDHDKLNHDVDYSRLAALCNKCHLNYDREHHMENARNNREAKKLLQRLF